MWLLGISAPAAAAHSVPPDPEAADLNSQALLFLPSWYAGFYESRTGPEPIPSERYGALNQGSMSEAGRQLALLYGYQYIIWARERAMLLAGEDPLVASLIATALTTVGTGALLTLGNQLQGKLYANSRVTLAGYRVGLSVSGDMHTGEWAGLAEIDMTPLLDSLVGGVDPSRGNAASVAQRHFWTPGNAFLFTAAPWGIYGPEGGHR